MPDNVDEAFMRRAIAVATEKGADPAVSPIGCVIVMDEAPWEFLQRCTLRNSAAAGR